MLQNHEVSASEKGMSRRSFLGYGAIGAGLLGASYSPLNFIPAVKPKGLAA